MPVGEIIGEPLRLHRSGSRDEIMERVKTLMGLVGLNPQYVRRYPHAFSGGQRQRIGIARALALNPDLIVCDEPVSALDVSVQSQVLNLLKDLQVELGLTYLFISHNLAVVDYIADEVAVMYAGRIVERGPKARLFTQPRHPYTEALLAAVLHPELRTRETARPLAADGSGLPAGAEACGYAPRCPYAEPRCWQEAPALAGVGPGHEARCLRADELKLAGIRPVGAAAPLA
jgi:peptide/nickel transport system ATP-binding protein